MDTAFSVRYFTTRTYLRLSSVISCRLGGENKLSNAIDNALRVLGYVQQLLTCYILTVFTLCLFACTVKLFQI